MNSFAMVFPGQGSQSLGMLKTIAEKYDEVKQTYRLASDALGYDLWQLTQVGPAEKLDQTVYTQPAILTASYAIWRILTARDMIKPQILAGHSLGEYTALVCAEALTFTDAVQLVAARGQYMQEAVAAGEGAMAAIIGLNEDKVAALGTQLAVTANDVLAPANFNSPGQIVIAGHRALVEQAIVAAKEQGAKLAVLLPVSVPSHCRLMLPAAKRLHAQLDNIVLHKPKIPVINNVDVKQYDDEQSIRDGLIRQLYSPVRWVEIIQMMANLGITKIVECGPGQVLTGLNKRIDKSLSFAMTAEIDNLEKVLQDKSFL